jgi:hypothetical protein
VYVQFLHPRTPFLVRIFLAELSNDISSSFNDTTLFDKLYKTKGFMEQGLRNAEIAEMMTDTTLEQGAVVVGESRISMLAQVRCTQHSSPPNTPSLLHATLTLVASFR